MKAVDLGLQRKESLLLPPIPLEEAVTLPHLTLQPSPRLPPRLPMDTHAYRYPVPLNFKLFFVLMY